MALVDLLDKSRQQNLGKGDKLAGVSMPSVEDLPPGPLRALVEAVHAVYDSAGKPPIRTISTAIKESDDFPDVASHETIAALLRGQSLPKWLKLESIIRALARMAIGNPDEEAAVREVHALWRSAVSATDSAGETVVMAGKIDLSEGPDLPPQVSYGELRREKESRRWRLPDLTYTWSLSERHYEPPTGMAPARLKAFYEDIPDPPPSVATLFIVYGPQPGASFLVKRGKNFIGRRPENDIVLSDGVVSRSHAALTWRVDQFVIEDLGSTNGTFVNRSQILSGVVSPRDEIQIGRTMFVLLVGR